jgi:hypothetical protein
MSTALMLTDATPESALAASSVQPTYFLHQLGDLLHPDLTIPAEISRHA